MPPVICVRSLVCAAALALLSLPGCSYESGDPAPSAGKPKPKLTPAEQAYELLVSGDYEGAIKEYDKVITADPNDPAAYLNRGIAAFQLGDDEAALADYVKAMDLDPDDPDPYINRSAIHQEHEEFDQAIADLDSALERSPKDSAIHAQRGSLYLMQGNLDAALEDFGSTLEQDETNADALLGMGDVLRRLGQHKKSWSYFDEAEHYHPEDPLVYLKRAQLWLDREEFNAAAEDCAYAILVDPRNPQAYVARGDILMAAGQEEAASEHYTEAIELDPEHAYAQLQRGLALEAIGDSAGAIRDFKRTIELQPDGVDARTHLAWLLSTHADEATRDGAQAVELATIACELTEWKSWIELSVLAAANAESGDFPAAVKWQEKAISLADLTEAEQAPLTARLEGFQQETPYRVATESPPVEDQPSGE